MVNNDRSKGLTSDKIARALSLAGNIDTFAQTSGKAHITVFDLKSGQDEQGKLFKGEMSYHRSSQVDDKRVCGM